MKSIVCKLFILALLMTSCSEDRNDKNVAPTAQPNGIANQGTQAGANSESSNLNLIFRDTLSGKLETIKPKYAVAYIDENYYEPVGDLFIKINETSGTEPTSKLNRGILFLTLKRVIGTTQKLEYPKQFTNPPSALCFDGDESENWASGEVILHSLGADFIDVEFKNVNGKNTQLSGRALMPLKN